MGCSFKIEATRSLTDAKLCPGLIPEGRFYLTMRPSGLKKLVKPSQIPSLVGVCHLHPFLSSLLGTKEIRFGKATPRQSYDYENHLRRKSPRRPQLSRSC